MLITLQRNLALVHAGRSICRRLDRAVFYNTICFISTAYRVMQSNTLQLGPKPLFLLRGVAVALLLMAWCFVPVQAQWINEIHYDNAGTDAGEFIEVAGPANTDLSGWSLVLYNGADGANYNTTLLSGIIPNQGNGLGVLVFSYPTNGIQNGAPDGVALVDDTDSVVEFLCYEGTFTASGGPADGIMCADIGVAESSSTPEGQSLQLIGNGASHSDFEWAGPLSATPGALNVGQHEESGCPDDYLDRAVVTFGDNTYLMDLCSIDPVADGNKWTYWVSELSGKDLSHWLIGFLCFDDATDFMPSGAEVGVDGSTGNAGIKWNVNDNFSEGLFSFVLPDIYSTAQTDVTVTSKASNDFSMASITGPSCEANVCTSSNAPSFGSVITTYGAGDDGAGYASVELTLPNGYDTSTPPTLGTPNKNTELVGVFQKSGFSYDPANPNGSGTPAGNGDQELLILLRAPNSGTSTFFVEFEDSKGCTGRIDPTADFGGTGRDAPERYALDQNYPNPFNPTTTISFELPESQQVRLIVYDVTGREVMTLINGTLSAGRHTASWDSRTSAGSLVPSGLYFYRLDAGNFSQVRQMLLIK